ncbi:hypothetical protein [Janthinobacterium sp. P210006]|uniref:hypothetical protein n=1 Tax=Janthinobacterium sp. P210006 TaxID=3112939 RepID=UPI002E2765E1|nr:hypothetical protein [Janthinobacterium sp. P210006]
MLLHFMHSAPAVRQPAAGKHQGKKENGQVPAWPSLQGIAQRCLEVVEFDILDMPAPDEKKPRHC